MDTTEYSEQSTLRIGESLESSQNKSRHRRLSGSAAEASLTDLGGQKIAKEDQSGYRRRSLSDSRSANARSSGKSFLIY